MALNCAIIALAQAGIAIFAQSFYKHRRQHQTPLEAVPICYETLKTL